MQFYQIYAGFCDRSFLPVEILGWAIWGSQPKLAKKSVLGYRFFYAAMHFLACNFGTMCLTDPFINF